MRRIFALLLFIFQLSCEGPSQRVPDDGLPSSMPTTITPITPPPIALSFNGPADGELATAASVNAPFQVLENSVEALRLLTYGGGFDVSVVATSDTSMSIAPLGAVVVQVAGVWKVYQHSLTSSIDPLALIGGAFAASTRYYVYAYVNAGVLSFQVSTTAPDTGHRYKAGDEQYQFITTFCTTSGSTLIPYRQIGRKYTYTDFTGTDQVTGSATVVTVVPFTVAVPTGASTVILQANFTAGAAGHSVTINTFYSLVACQAAPGTNNQLVTQCEVPGISGFEYKVENALDAVVIYAYSFTY